MVRVLNVCVGNLCRSPLAERLFRLGADTTGIEIDSSSAGVRASNGRAMDASSAAELIRLGGSAEGFASRRLTESLVADTDLVLTATTDVRKAVLHEAPAAMRRTFTLLEFAALAELAAAEGVLNDELIAWAASHRPKVADRELDVTDPIGQSEGVHRQVADTIEAAVASILRVWAGQVE